MTAVRIVEDDPDIGVLYRHVLERAGCDIVDVADVADGLFTVDVWDRVDVAVIDLMLAGSTHNGGALAVWIADNTDVRPVLVTAADARTLADVRDSLAGRAVVMLQKPVNLDLLIDTVLGDTP